MAICPKCKAVIDYLDLFVKKEAKYTLTETGAIPDYECDDEEVAAIECPECSENLFECEDEAQAFLQNKDELQELVLEAAGREHEH